MGSTRIRLRTRGTGNTTAEATSSQSSPELPSEPDAGLLPGPVRANDGDGTTEQRPSTTEEDGELAVSTPRASAPRNKETSATLGSGKKKNSGTKGGTLQAKWEEMFNRLLAYKKENGDCLVPNRYEPDPALGAWVSTQRRQYKAMTTPGSAATPITPQRAARLNSIGFAWATKDPRHTPWETRYAQLRQFVMDHGKHNETLQSLLLLLLLI